MPKNYSSPAAAYRPSHGGYPTTPPTNDPADVAHDPSACPICVRVLGEVNR